ncbi:glycosyl transferase [soil metagenome]
MPSQLATPALLPYDHLKRLSDHVGLFEHALGDTPRIDHGYCVDDVARGLLVVAREPHPDEDLQRLASTYLRFLENAAVQDGRVHNRMRFAGQWTDEAAVGDCWGRALWALGTMGSRMSALAPQSRRTFRVLARQRCGDVRAAAFAALGAGELLLAGRRSPRTYRLLADAVTKIPTKPTASWDWPEPRLRYANAALAEAIMVAGRALSDRDLEQRGLELISALIAIETRDGHLSVCGTSGRGPGEKGPQFDQQPIEVAAIADAAARAFDFTGQSDWRDVVAMSWAWFLGDNDSAVAMIDPVSGAGFDGLEPEGRNDNRGAESTLAALSTWQQARRLGVVPGPTA